MTKRYVIRKEEDYSTAGGCLLFLIVIVAIVVYVFLKILPFLAAFAAGFLVFLLAEHLLLQYKIKHSLIVALLFAVLAAYPSFTYTKSYSDSILLRYMSDLSIDPTPSSLKSSLNGIEWSGTKKYDFKDLSNCYHTKHDEMEVFGCRSGYYLMNDTNGKIFRCTISDARIAKKENEDEKARLTTVGCTSSNKG